MKIVVFRHFSFDDPSMIVSWSQHSGHELAIYDPSQGIEQAWLQTLDLLIIMGGPMSVYQESKYPWLIEEKEFVKQAIHMGKRVLGICLGAQMIAEILGGAVHSNLHKEIGWHKLQRTSEFHPWLADIPEQFISFAWHGDTFTLPTGARHLIYSEACENQAFAYGEHVLGLQFHLESTSNCILQMLSNWSQELQVAPHIQQASTIRDQLARCEQSRALLWNILDRMACYE